MKIAEKLTYLKKKYHITNEELAQRACVPLGTVNKICAGQTKRPSLESMARICNVLHVPIDYLTGGAPPDCDIAVYADTVGLSLISKEESDHLASYRRMAAYNRRSIDRLMARLADQPQVHACDGRPVKRLLCYLLADCGKRGTLWDISVCRPLLVALDEDSDLADFAVQILGDALMPIYGSGTILLFRHVDARHGQLGLFVVNSQVVLRRYSCRRGVRKLVASQNGIRDILLTNPGACQCMGLLLGDAHGYRWL